MTLKIMSTPVVSSTVSGSGVPGSLLSCIVSSLVRSGSGSGASGVSVSKPECVCKYSTYAVVASVSSGVSVLVVVSGTCVVVTSLSVSGANSGTSVSVVISSVSTACLPTVV